MGFFFSRELLVVWIGCGVRGGVGVGWGGVAEVVQCLQGVEAGLLADALFETNAESTPSPTCPACRVSAMVSAAARIASWPLGGFPRCVWRVRNCRGRTRGV